MAINNTLNMAEEDEKKRLAEELKARQKALNDQTVQQDQARFADLFNPGSPEAQQAGRAMMEQSFLNPNRRISDIRYEEQGMPQPSGKTITDEAQAEFEQRHWDNSLMGRLQGPQPDAVVPLDPRQKLKQDINNLGVNRNIMPNVTLPEGYLSTVAALESGGDPNAQSRMSSAKGLYQFTDATASSLGIDPMDPEQALQGMQTLTKENYDRFVRERGREPTGSELYMMHQQGAPKAMKMFNADPNEKAVAVLGRDQVINNGGNENMTVGEFQTHWDNKYRKQDAYLSQSIGESQVPGQIDPRQSYPQYYEGGYGVEGYTPISYTPPVQTADEREAESTGGANLAQKNGIPPGPANYMSNPENFKQNDKGMWEFDAAELGLNFKSDFQHANRESSDLGALFQGLLAGGIAAIGAKMAGGSSEDIGASFFVGSTLRFTDAMNQSHRYKNIQALTEMGYKPESIEQYVISGDREDLKKYEVDAWKEYPDGSGRQYRQLPDGKVQVMRGPAKWEKIEVDDGQGNLVTRYWNDFYGWRQNKEGQIIQGNVAPKNQTVTGTVQTFHNPNIPGSEVEVLRKGDRWVYANQPSRDASAAVQGLVIKQKATAGKTPKGYIDPKSQEGIAAAQATKADTENRLKVIQNISRSPVLKNLTGTKGVLVGDLYKRFGTQEKLLDSLFGQLGGKLFLDAIPKMKGFGALSNAEGDKVSRSASALISTDKDGKQTFNKGLPAGYVAYELRNLVEGSLAHDYIVSSLVNAKRTEESLSPEEREALIRGKDEYVRQIMQRDYPELANVPEYDWGAAETQANAEKEAKVKNEDQLYKVGAQPNQTQPQMNPSNWQYWAQQQ